MVDSDCCLTWEDQREFVLYKSVNAALPGKKAFKSPVVVVVVVVVS